MQKGPCVDGGKLHHCLVKYKLTANLSTNSKNAPRGLYFSKALFRGLFLERLIFGRAYIRREICVSKSIGLALKMEGNLPF